MSHDPEIASFRVGGVPVAVTDMTGFVASVARQLRRGPEAPGAYVAFMGAHGVVECQNDPRVRQAHEGAYLAVADGRPLMWIGRARGLAGIGQVPGIEAVERVCRDGVASGWRHYFLGGGPGVAERLAQEMQSRVPDLQVAGCETPPFRALTPEETQAMHARIRESGAQIVWIGLGAPKQELFMAEHAPHLPGTVLMGVGAAFDVNIGKVPRAPRLLRMAGFEWAYRLAREPKRLWSRYSVVVPRFLLIALLALLARQASRMQAQ